jgi:hypothetical protein
MVCRSWVIRAGPAAAISRAPAMTARSKARPGKDKVNSQEADARGVRVLDDEDHCHSEGREARDQPGGPPDGPRRPWPVPPAGAETGPPRPTGSKVAGHAGELVQCLRRNRTTSTMITMITMAPKPMNMRYALRYMRISWR